jgi:hypothetical protein
MKLMETIEGHVGQIDFCPSYILIYTFAYHPSPVAASFFFGNDVPCELTCRFYQTCNGTVSRSVAVSRFVDEQFQEWYSAWERSKNKIHMAEYYNMRLRKLMYINGSNYNQCEPVMPELPVLIFNINNTGCRLLTRGVLENVEKLDI